jgi:hypothetical protein
VRADTSRFEQLDLGRHARRNGDDRSWVTHAKEARELDRAWLGQRALDEYQVDRLITYETSRLDCGANATDHREAWLAAQAGADLLGDDWLTLDDEEAGRF